MDSKETVTSSLESLSCAVIKIFKDLSEIAEKRVSTYLIAFGSLLLLLSLFSRLEIFGFKFTSLYPAEFVTIIIAGTIFIVLGALLRYYLYVNNYELVKNQQKFGSEIIKDVLDKGKDLLSTKPDNSSLI